jgi:hypothetical protein
VEEEFLRYSTACAERVVFFLELWCWWPPLPLPPPPPPCLPWELPPLELLL